MAANHNFEISQGSNFSVLLTIKDSLGDAIDLTGHVFTGQIRKTVSDTQIQASFSFELLDQSVLLTKGKVRVYLLASDSSGIDLGNQNSIRKTIVEMPYDIQSSLSGNVTRWIEGLVRISPEITR
jgi:hypothetical protein